MKTKLILFALFILSMCMNSCNNTADTKTESQETKIDSAAYVLQVLDSLEKGGAICHKEEWEIGAFGERYVSETRICVNRVSLSSDTLYYVSIEGYRIRYSKTVLVDVEIPAFRKAIKEMIENCKRETEKHEEYTYVSKSGLILITAIGDEKGKYSIDMYLSGKDNDYLHYSKEELKKLDSCLNQAQILIRTLKKK